MILGMLIAAGLPTASTVVFGLLWLHELRARHAAETERDRLWDETHASVRRVG